MVRSYRYPLRLTIQQEATFQSWLEQCRQLYNAALQQRIEAYRRQSRSLSLFDQQKELTALRAGFPEFKEVPAVVLRSALHRLNGAYQTFFRRIKAGERAGYPRFRGDGRYDSFRFQRAFPVEGDQICLPKLGPVRFHRYRDPKGVLKDVTVRRDAAGRWWLTLQCDVGSIPQKTDPRKIIGVDVGLESLAVTSEAEVVGNPRHLRRAQQRLAQRQRHLQKKRRGSRGRERQRRLLAKAHLHVRNQRLDTARKMAADLYNKYDAVIVEKLNMRGLVRGWLAKSVHDAGWGILIQALHCKAESAGKHCVEVDPRYTSQTCSACGRVEKKDLGERQHRCPCGFSTTRDHNAALNIEARGRAQLGLAPGRGADPRQLVLPDLKGATPATELRNDQTFKA